MYNVACQGKEVPRLVELVRTCPSNLVLVLTQQVWSGYGPGETPNETGVVFRRITKPAMAPMVFELSRAFDAVLTDSLAITAFDVSTGYEAISGSFAGFLMSTDLSPALWQGLALILFASQPFLFPRGVEHQVNG